MSKDVEIEPTTVAILAFRRSCPDFSALTTRLDLTHDSNRLDLRRHSHNDNNIILIGDDINIMYRCSVSITF